MEAVEGAFEEAGESLPLLVEKSVELEFMIAGPLEAER